jgi:hypothetical protein
MRAREKSLGLLMIPSLYTMVSSADIVSTLFAHGMILSRDTSGKPATTSNSSNTALAARTNEGCTNPNCKAKKRSTHTFPDCYWPGSGKEGQFPPNFGQRSNANIAMPNTTAATSNTTTVTPSTTTGQTQQCQHFVLSARIPKTPGQTGILINDIPISHNPAALISSGFQKFGKGKVPTFMGRDSGSDCQGLVNPRGLWVGYTRVGVCMG